MKNIFVGLAMVLLATCSYGAYTDLQWDIKYDADKLPTNTSTNPTPVQAWNGTAYMDASRFTAAGTAAATVLTNVNSGVLFASTLGLVTNGDAYWSRNLTGGYPTGTVLPQASVGYTTEMRLKMISTENTASFFFAMDEGTSGVDKYWSLRFSENPSGLDAGMYVYIVGANIGFTTLVDAGTARNFHTYRVVSNPTSFSLYIDGDITAADTRNYGATAYNKFLFGDTAATTSADMSYELDYIGIYSRGAVVPEPATMLLLGVGNLCLSLRKKHN